MKKLLLAIFSMISFISYSQTTGYFRYDTVRIQRPGGNSTLIIENATRDSLGFLYNYGGGRTKFEVIRSVPGGIKVGDDTIIVNQSSEDRLIQPGYVTYSGTGFKFYITPSIISVGGVIYLTDQDSVTLSPSDPDDPRIDVIYVATTGIEVKEGTPAGPAAEPQLDGGEFKLTHINIPAGSTTPDITITTIYDENTAPEWIPITQTGTTIDADQTAVVFKGAKALNVTGLTNDDKIQFPGGSTIDISSKHAISGFIKLKATMSGAANLRLRFFNGATVISNEVIIALNKNSTVWQAFSVPVSDFNFTGNTFADRVQIRYTGSVSHAGFYHDYFHFETGMLQPGSTTELAVGPIDGKPANANGLTIANGYAYQQHVTQTVPGLMSAADKTKLDSLHSDYFIENIGDGEELATQPNDSTIGIKSLKAGTNVTLDVTDTTVTVNATGGVNGIDDVLALQQPFTTDRKISGNGFQFTVDSCVNINLFSGLEFISSGIGSSIQMSDSVMSLTSSSASDFSTIQTTPTSIKFIPFDGVGSVGYIWTNLGDGKGHWEAGGGGGGGATDYGPDFTLVTDSLFIANKVNVKRYGAVGDGVTNDQPAIAAAIAAMSATQTLYFPAGNYLVSSTVTVNKSITIEGEPFARIKITGDFSAFTLAANVIKIHKLSFIGSGKAGGNTSQRGIDCNGYSYFDIAGCEFYDLNGIGLYWLNTDTLSSREGGRVSNCYFKDNMVGFYSGPKGEYVTVTGGAAQGNNFGGVIIGGNVAISNMNISDNGIGLDYRSGTNNGHGTVSSCMINHNTTYNVKVADVPLGVVFSGCQMFDSNIWLKNTDGIIFSGCELAPIAFFFENSKNTTISSSTFYTAYGFTINNNYNSTTSSTYWTANTKLAGTQGWIEGTDITTTGGKVGDIVRYLEGSTASSSTPTPTGNARDNTYVVTALAANATFGAPTGTAANNNRLLLRVKDNGTARTLAFNAIYTGTLPTTTVVGETIYLPFVYNSTSVKWELTESSGGGSGIGEVVAGYGLLNVNDSTLRVDTALISTRAWRDKGLDSLGAIIDAIVGGENSKTRAFETPSAAENLTYFFTDSAITVTKVADVLQGTSPSVTYNIFFSTTRDDSTPDSLFSSPRTATSVSGATTTTFNDNTIPSGSWVWLKTYATSGTVNEIAVTVLYPLGTSSVSGSGTGDVVKVGTPSNHQWGVWTGDGTLKGVTVTASRAIASDANGDPVAATTTATELGYVNGVTSPIQTQINAKFSLNLIAGLATTVTDGATLYFGNIVAAPSTAFASFYITIDRACTLSAATIESLAGTAGSAEAWSFYVRVNDATDYLIETVGVSAARRIWDNNAMNISLSAGDQVAIKFVNPTWATNPANVYLNGYMIFK